METVISIIKSDRELFLSEVIVPKQSLPVHEYDVEAALVDAREYHNKGSFYSGLARLQEIAETTSNSNKATSKKTEDERLEKLKQRPTAVNLNIINDKNNILKTANAGDTVHALYDFIDPKERNEIHAPIIKWFLINNSKTVLVGNGLSYTIECKIEPNHKLYFEVLPIADGKSSTYAVGEIVQSDFIQIIPSK
jgi:hypothetical protein